MLVRRRQPTGVDNPTNPAHFSAGAVSGRTRLLLILWVIAAVYAALPSSALALSNTSRPYITGTAVVGQTLTGHPGDWDQPVSSYSFSWYRCEPDNPADDPNWRDACTEVPETRFYGDSSTYDLKSSDLGYKMRLGVYATQVTGPDPGCYPYPDGSPNSVICPGPPTTSGTADSEPTEPVGAHSPADALPPPADVVRDATRSPAPPAQLECGDEAAQTFTSMFTTNGFSAAPRLPGSGSVLGTEQGPMVITPDDAPGTAESGPITLRGLGLRISDARPGSQWNLDLAEGQRLQQVSPREVLVTDASGTGVATLRAAGPSVGDDPEAPVLSADASKEGRVNIGGSTPTTVDLNPTGAAPNPLGMPVCAPPHGNSPRSPCHRLVHQVSIQCVQPILDSNSRTPAAHERPCSTHVPSCGQGLFQGSNRDAVCR